MQLHTAPQQLAGSARRAALPQQLQPARQPALPLRSRFVVRAEAEQTSATEQAEPAAPPPQPKQKSSWEVTAFSCTSFAVTGALLRVHTLLCPTTGFVCAPDCMCMHGAWFVGRRRPWYTCACTICDAMRAALQRTCAELKGVVSLCSSSRSPCAAAVRRTAASRCRSATTSLTTC